ncbi:MAG: 1-deoxy-D-xylulose-5-phosphate reductoisomerase [Candidatus Omnitrophica bacterium]|nr:1-deoxy-D-xylulose-5-phosphate reductoisomerase [Candidatus Omnitrophota bacterium]
MKRLLILGSTGSIGRNTLAVVRRFSRRFSVEGLTTYSNIGVLQGQIKEFKPRYVYVEDTLKALVLKERLSLKKTKLILGEGALKKMIQDENIDTVIFALPGSRGFIPLIWAIESKKEIILASKEPLVMAGRFIMQKAYKSKVKILPVDSEQSAIWQCIEGKDKSKIKCVYLTASGGPLRKVPLGDFKNVSLKKLLRHPCWKMGKKITVDSASLMNKGFEVIETKFLFDIPLEKIKVLIHPQAIVHSMVEFCDGTIFAHLAIPDMRLPIQYALFYPERPENSFGIVDFYRLKNLSFYKPDFKKFKCLSLAYEVAKKGGTSLAVLNSSDEVCVQEVLKGKMKFFLIPEVIKKVLDLHKNKTNPSIEDILWSDIWARQKTYEVISKLN